MKHCGEHSARTAASAKLGPAAGRESVGQETGPRQKRNSYSSPLQTAPLPACPARYIGLGVRWG